MTLSHRIRQALAALGFLVLAPGAANAAFKFEQFASLDDVRGYITAHLPLGSARENVRHIFVEEGGARVQSYPGNPTIEKYTYNINLCRTYVWRWNISANYNADGSLTQAFVNGEPVHAAGDPRRSSQAVQKPAGRGKIEKGWKHRPEADRGENALAYIRLNLEASSNDVGNKFIIGGGPTRADPANMGALHAYSDVEQWRSIFDDERGEPVHDYSGNCPPNSRTGPLYPEPFDPSLAQ